MSGYPLHLTELSYGQKRFLIEQILAFLDHYGKCVGHGYSVYRVAPELAPGCYQTDNGLILQYWGDRPWFLCTPWGRLLFGTDRYRFDYGTVIAPLRVQRLESAGGESRCAILAINGVQLPEPRVLPNSPVGDPAVGVMTEFEELVCYPDGWTSHR